MNLLRLIVILVIAAVGSLALSGQSPAAPPSDVQNHLRMARSLETQGKLDLALDEIRQFREIHPQSVDGAVAEARLLLLENDLSDAAVLLNSVLVLHPNRLKQ